jgi:cytochrome c oxidase assembly protein subunit 15
MKSTLSRHTQLLLDAQSGTTRTAALAWTYDRDVPFSSLRARIERLPAPSVGLQRGFAFAVVATQALIAVTGSVVRVTGSGLGCPTWPECVPGSMVPVEHREFATLNQWIEYGNRLFTGIVGIIALACFVLAWLAKPRRTRYVRLAAAMPLGVVVQAVIGGITVRMDLLWWTVAVHLLASTIMVWLAVMLVHEVDPRPAQAAPAGVRGLLIIQTGVLACLLIAGTLVTGAGPHAGNPQTPRLRIPVDTLAHAHAAFLFVFVGMLLALGVLLWVGGSPRALRVRYGVLAGVTLGQGTLGFVQYWTGVPEMLVSLHVLGAMTVIIATASLWCASRGRKDTVGGARDSGQADGRPGSNGVRRDPAGLAGAR